jgi:hypothetical protein
LPEKVTHNRIGALLATVEEFVSSPQTRSDSIQGSAIETPRPCRNVRREK